MVIKDYYLLAYLLTYLLIFNVLAHTLP